MNARFLSLFVAVPFFACSPAPDTQVDEEAAIASIEQMLRDASAANQNQDVEAWLSNLTEDAIVMPPNEPSVEGKTSLRTWIEERFSEVHAHVTITPLEIVVDHDIAFNRTHVTGFSVMRETGDTAEVDYKEIAILRRQANGDWLVSRLIGNSNLPE